MKPMSHRELMLALLKGQHVAIENRQFVGLDLDYHELSSVTFRNCSLRRCTLRGARLASARFENCSLVDCDASASVWTGAHVDGGSLVECDFTNARLTSTNWTGTRLARCKMEGAELRFADFTTANLIDLAQVYRDAIAKIDVGMDGGEHLPQ